MYQIAAQTAEPPSDQPTSTILAQLLTNLSGDRVTVGEIMDAAGSRAYALALLLFALPEALPLPIAGMLAIVALPLLLLSVQLIASGAEPRLPDWLRRRSVSAQVFRTVVSKAVPVFHRIERLSRPRWQRLAGASRMLGLACLTLAVVIALPIPLGNLAPAVCVAFIAFGMLQRDGLIVAGALAASTAMVTGMAAAIVLAADFMVETIGNLGAL
jgi:hypothetical protein